MILMDIYCLLGLLVLGLLCRKWSMISPFARFQVLCLTYLLSILVVFCLAGSFPERSFHFSWKYFTIVNHCVFISIWCYLLKNRTILPILIRESKYQIDTRQKLYQTSDAHLITEDDFVENPRASMQGSPPLADCQVCYSEESCFCYFNCKHAVVGK